MCKLWLHAAGQGSLQVAGMVAPSGNGMQLAAGATRRTTNIAGYQPLVAILLCQLSQITGLCRTARFRTAVAMVSTGPVQPIILRRGILPRTEQMF